MDPQRAIKLLRDQIGEGQRVIEGDVNFTEWKSKSRLVLAVLYGDDGSLVRQFDDVAYHLGMWTDRTPASRHRDARHAGVRRAMALLESAIFERQHLASVPTNEGDSVDPELWDHISHLVEDEKWSQVASVTATFVEDKVREWSGLGPQHFGKDLMVKAFKADDDGPLACGRTAGERLGWQQLATGFVQALSNVDRHRIQRRDDARTYAMGVLGAASLILTQLRHEHGFESKPAEADAS